MSQPQPKKIRKAVFPVGGLGTRFLPATKAMPKEMLPVGNVPLIQHAFEEARDAGIEQFIFITGRNKNAINNHFDIVYELNSFLSEQNKSQAIKSTTDWLPEPGSIIFIRQQVPAGLGHAVWCARDVIGDEPFAVILADELLSTKQNFLAEMIDHHQSFGGNIIGLAEVEPALVSRYGIAAAEEHGPRTVKVRELVEKPAPDQAPSNLSIIGRYILQPEIFTFLSQAKPGINGEIQLSDCLRQMLSTHQFLGALFKGDRFDCGEPIGWLDANVSYMLRAMGNTKAIKSILTKHLDLCSA